MNHRLLRRAAAWVPVACLLGVTVASAPATSRSGESGSLGVTPRDFYGGQAVTFRGATGRQGRTPIWLEFHMGRSGDSWTRIEGSGQRTAPDGSFDFRFPARGMLNIQVRVAWRGGATPPELFRAHDQAVSLSVQPSDGRLYSNGPCSASYRRFLSYETVSQEPSTIVVDTAAGGGPVLAGRRLTLQRRVDGDTWRQVATGSVGADGTHAFRDVRVTGSAPVAFRVRMEPWTAGGSEIGWFPSFPTYLEPLHRPAAVGSASASRPGVDPGLGAPHPEVLDLGWTLPVDDRTKEVVLAWNRDGGPVTDLGRADVVRVLDASGGSVVDGLVPARQYRFAVLTRSEDGICSAAVAATGTTAPAPTPEPVPSLAGTAGADRVGLDWVLPARTASLVAVAVTRVVGAGPAAPPRTGRDVVGAGDLAAGTTSFTDTGVAPSTTYTYGVFVRNRWGVWSPLGAGSAVTVTTQEEQ